jgi:hypothetical protein
MPEELRNTTRWPAASTHHLDGDGRLRMMRLREITRGYLGFRPIAHKLKRAAATYRHFPLAVPVSAGRPGEDPHRHWRAIPGGAAPWNPWAD